MHSRSPLTNVLANPIVLVAEDNDVVSDFLRDTFQAYGYKTLLAANRDQAVAHCQREGNAIQALVANVSPGGSGDFETALMLMRICPAMKVILISGYPYDYLVRAGVLPAELEMTTFLQKPFVPSEIISVLRSPQRVS